MIHVNIESMSGEAHVSITEYPYGAIEEAPEPEERSNGLHGVHRVTGQDVEAAQELTDRELMRYVDTYRVLAEQATRTVSRVAAVVRDAAGNYGVLVSGLRSAVRPLAGVLGDGSLLRLVDDVLPGREAPEQEGTGPYGVTDVTSAEELARRILQRQIASGEARVPWEERTDSRRKRIAAAEVLLRRLEGLMADEGPRSWEHMADELQEALVDVMDFRAGLARRIVTHALHALYSARQPQAAGA